MELHARLKLLSFFLFYFLFTRRIALGVSVNRTIDDQFGDSVTGNLVQYSPDGFWAQGDTCSYCAFHPSNSSAYNGTWHDGTRVPEHDIEPLAFTFKFNGTAVYIFNIAVRLTLTDVNFTLDGTLVGRYTEFYNISEQYVYSVPILSLNGIPYGEHTLTVDAFGPNQTLVLFDYAIYTTNTTESADGPSTTSGRGSSTTPHKSNVGAIAGGVVGGCLLLLTIGLTLCLYQRHRNIAPEVTPFHTPAIPILSERTPTLIANNQRVLHDMDIPPTPLLLSEKSPSTTDITSLNPNPLTATSESSSLREQVMNLRVELDALRSRKSSSTPSQSTTTRHPPSSITTPLKSEIALLREELSQIKARQDREQTPTRPSIPPVNEGLIREVASLRAELEEMRSQQELVQLGDLPRYSPPPPNSAFMSALPSSAGVRPYGH